MPNELHFGTLLAGAPFSSHSGSYHLGHPKHDFLARVVDQLVKVMTSQVVDLVATSIFVGD